MSPEMDGDEALERSRLGELYVRHGADGIRLAYLLTGDRTLAEDLLQDAFAHVVGRFHHLRYPEAFAPYLRRTILNLSRSHFRRRRVERAYAERLARAPDRLGNPNDELDMSVHEALLRLPARQRAAMVLRFYEDLTAEQTAEVMGCSSGTVRALVFRGMRTLRSELEETR